MKEIADSELARYGVRTGHSIMDNGELRFRLTGSDGSCYIRTEAAADSGWQNSHYHTKLSEVCVVQSGFVIYAELLDGRVSAHRYTPGETYLIRPMIPHNTFLSPHCVLHTVKFGDCTDADWIPCPELDALVKHTDPECYE